ncbi:MAG: hypothetical protein PHG58_02170 [Clostridia bacterium]|nr:hypothetical protein [Clostridia bacterium]
MEPIAMREELTRRIYDLECDNIKYKIISEQPLGSRDTYFTLLPVLGYPNAYFTYWADGLGLAPCSVGWELSSVCNQNAGQRTLPIPPGAVVHMQILREDNKPLTPVFTLNAICRYPYGRTFEEYKHTLTQHNGQSRVIGYDLEYYTTDEPIAPVRRRLGNTNCELYLDHIVASVIDPSMTQMEKARAIWKFISMAIQHNNIHMNLRETVPALEGYAENPEGDFDEVTVWLIELGHTRCGAINGFVSAALLKRVGIASRNVRACGGHTAGSVLVDGKERFWDPDAYKGVIPLDEKGGIPARDWLMAAPENYLLLDTLPAWVDATIEDGYLTSHEGYRMTGVVRALPDPDAGYPSSFHGAVKSYPPMVPELLPVTFRCGKLVRLEWYGSYDRDGDFKDYLVTVTTQDGSVILCQETVNPWIETELPVIPGLMFTVQARDRHGEGSPYEGKIHYASAKPVDIPANNVNLPYSWDMLSQSDYNGRTNLVAKGHVFECIEGRNNAAGQTIVAVTNLWDTICARAQKRVLRMVDITNYLFSGTSVRSLFACPLPVIKTTAEGWHLTAVLRVLPFDIAGYGRFPLLWVGQHDSHIGIGLGMDCKAGLLRASSNVMGDWRMFEGFKARGVFRFDMICDKGEKRVRYYVDGVCFAIQDYTTFSEGNFDIDTVYLSGNPDAETSYLVYDLLI